MDEIQWITIINFGYVHYAQNFLQSIIVRGFDFNITIYCLDNESYLALNGKPHCTCVDASVFMKKKYEQRLCVWGTTEYKQLVVAKLDAILYSLEHTNSAVGYIDMDIVLFSDPTIVIQECMKKNPLVQIFAQCDEVAPECYNFNKCRSVCSGVIVFRNNSVCKNLLVHTEAEVMQYGTDDQMFIMKKCNHYNIPRMSISKNVFLHGAYPHLQHKKIEFPRTACLVHFNHVFDNDRAKQKIMMLQGLWYL